MSNASPAVPESRLWEWLSKARRVFKSRLHISRIENEIGRGIPDTEACLDGVQLWIELKCTKRPANSTTRLKIIFQAGQPEWLRRRVRAGGRAFVLVQVGKGGEARRYLVPGDLAEQLEEGVTEEELVPLSVDFVDDKDPTSILRRAVSIPL